MTRLPRCLLSPMVVFAILASPAAFAQGFLQGDDPLLVLPDVFVIIDTSGSMASGWYPCGVAGALTCDRRYATRQVLTGTYLGVRGDCSTQLEDGILDAYKENIRFGFSTFDNDRCDTHGDLTVWDYGDDTKTNQRLGIKTRGAFQGALVDLVDPADPANFLANNARVQTAACQTTAYNCTPLSASLYDAHYYYDHWMAEIGYDDTLAACRPRFVLLMSDGAQYPGSGWYVSPEYQASELYAAGIPVFVVGFGDPGLGWSLHSIALAGSGGMIPAFMAENPTQLFIAFSLVLDAILSGTTSRTELVSSSSHANFDEAYQYAAYFEITLSGLGWQGHLVQLPVTGMDGAGNPIYGPTTDWLYFDEVLADSSPNARRIYTVIDDPRSKDFDWRPYSSTFDPTHLPRPVDDANPERGLVSFKTGMHDDQLLPWMCLAGATTRPCSVDAQCNTSSSYYCNSGICQLCSAVVDGTCSAWVAGDYEGYSGDPAVLADEMNKIRDWMRGVPGTPSYGDKYFITRPFLGDIFHSNPVVVHPPSALTPNYKYESYFRRNFNRDTMVYVGANDGMLHAFVAEDNDGDDDRGDEAWAFVPNNLLASVQKTRMSHRAFVDGSPVVRDVYFNNIQARDLEGELLESGGEPILGSYRTVLISGERAGGSAYFALDVTEPHQPSYLWEYRTDVNINRDYAATQCKYSVMQSWARPIVGQVWLKDEKAAGDEPDYFSKSVMIVPGGYVPPQALMEVSSCIDLMELLVGAASLHVIDVETGELLKRFLFSDEIDQDNLDLLDEFYAELANDPDGQWMHWGAGNNFGGEGWDCSEKRHAISTSVPLPPELLEHCVVEDTDDLYRMECCQHNGTGECKAEGLTSCYYLYEKKKNVPGGLHVFLKTEGCHMVEADDEYGRFELTVADDIWLESVNATPAAYNTNLGDYITRVFVPTTNGRIWRVDMGNALYNRDGDETATSGDERLIKEHTPSTKTYCWDVGRSGDASCDYGADPVPWFDMVRDDPQVDEDGRRPIMVDPTLAIDYSRDLVLFFGTGYIDNLEYTDTYDYFYGVREGRALGADEFFDPETIGSLVDVERFDEYKSERLFGKPLVAGGNVFFNTYVPIDNDCLPGFARIFGWRFDDFDSGDNPIPNPKLMDSAGTPSSPKLVFTPDGPLVMTQQGTTLQKIPVGDSIKPSSQILHWGKVL